MKRHTISETEKMRLSRAEVRNAELSSEIHAKSQQAQLLALKISVSLAFLYKYIVVD